MKPPICFTPDEQAHLVALAVGGAPAGETLGLPPISERETVHVRIRAKILLMLQEQVRNEDIAQACGCTGGTVYNIRRRYEKGGLTAALVYHTNYTYTGCITAEVAERITALSRSDPPEGLRKWTMDRLTQEVMNRGIVESISYHTVARILRKRLPSRAPRQAAPPSKPNPRVRHPGLTLKPGDKERLEAIVNAREEPAAWAPWQVMRAAVLLHLALTPPLLKREIAERCRCTIPTIAKTTRQYEREGLDRVLNRDRGKRTGEKKDAADQRAVDQRSTDQRSTDQRSTDQKSADHRLTDLVSAGQKSADQGAA
ncbi:hypothetical protein FACS1894137_08860 [Spirochaetia bacterium]|nr:hypothetical protein FACS1894137_08860 [Spirochaetia bacterium]